MTEHLPECPILKPCCDDEEFPEHGFCGNYAGRCLHCMAECICEQLRACEARVLGEAVQRVEVLLEEWWEKFEGTPSDLKEMKSMVALNRAIAAIDALKGDQR